MFPEFCDVFNYSSTDLDTYKIQFPETAGFANKILIISATLLLVIICEFKYFNFDTMWSIDIFLLFRITWYLKLRDTSIGFVRNVWNWEGISEVDFIMCLISKYIDIYKSLNKFLCIFIFSHVTYCQNHFAFRRNKAVIS